MSFAPTEGVGLRMKVKGTAEPVVFKTLPTSVCIAAEPFAAMMALSGETIKNIPNP